MTDVDSRLNGRKPVWAAPGSCSGSADDLIGLSPARYAEDNPDDHEAAALLRAFTAGNASLRESQGLVNAAGAELVSRYHAARAAIDGIDRFRSTGSVSEACEENARVVQRHTGDGPEDRRRRAVHPAALWVVLVVSAVFDASFIGSVMQQIFDVGSDNILYYFAYLPGVGIAVCLYAAGALLAEHLFRRRERLGRRRMVPKLNPAVAFRRAFWDWRPQMQVRRSDDLPWSRLPGPVLFTAFVFVLLGLAALARARESVREIPALRPYLVVFVVLIVLLSIGAVALKVLSHNPHAASSKQAKDLVSKAEEQATALVRDARWAAAEHVKAWNAVHAAIGTAEARAREVVEEACARMLETRARRSPRDTTKITLPLVWLAWPGGNGQEPRRDTELPGLDRSIVKYAAEAAARHAPEPLEAALQAAVDQLNKQFDVGRTGRDEPSAGPAVPA